MSEAIFRKVQRGLGVKLGTLHGAVIRECSTVSRAYQFRVFPDAVPKRLRLIDTEFVELYKLSINEPESFWDGVWEHAELIGSRNGRTLSDHSAMQGTKFYPQSTLNFAENCLAHDTPDSQAAVISYAEAEERTELTW